MWFELASVPRYKCVCVCTRASIPRGPLIFPALLYERSSSERAADVGALTFLVAAARAGVERHPAPSKQRLGARTHGSPSLRERTLPPQVLC